VRIFPTDGDNITCVFANTPEEAKNSVLIIPGIMGSTIFKQSELLWPDVSRMLITPNDKFMDSLMFSSNGQPVDNSLRVGAVINEATGLDYTKSLLIDLEKLGYSLGKDAVLLPYDWRQDIRDIALGQLMNKIDELAPAGGSKKLDIVAHSQGGLIIKYLLFTHPEYKSRIGKLIILGTPNLGAPKAAKALLYGDSMGVAFAGLGLDPEELRRIGANMPSVYGLLPSPEYFQHYDGYLGQASRAHIWEPWQTSLFGQQQTTEALRNAGLNGNLLNSASTLHTAQFDNYDLSGGDMKLYNLVGCQEATITQVLQRPGGKYRLAYGPGDGTVPIKSANNLYGQTKTYYALTGDHGRMLTQEGTRQQILALLSGKEAVEVGQSLTTDQNQCAFEGQVVSVHSPVDIHVYDELGRHTGLTSEGSLELGIPGSQYDTVGEEKFVWLPKNGYFEVELEATGQGSFSLLQEEVAGDGVAGMSVFSDVQIDLGSKARLSIEDGQGTDLEVDREGDGTYERTLQPVLLTGAQSEDFTAPISSALVSGTAGEVGYYRSKVSVGLSAEDPAAEIGSASGVANIEYQINGGAWQAYSSELSFPNEGTFELKYFASDKAGNIEEPKILNFSIDLSLPEATLRFNPATQTLDVTSLENNVNVSKLGDTITLSDKAGNKTELGFVEKDFKRALSAELKSIKYNGVAANLQDNKFKLGWTMKNGQLQTLVQYVASATNYYVLATYAKQITTITSLTTSPVKLDRSSLSGLHVISIGTSKGKLSWRVE
jgi:pimeloyl-ACP methyl ester carboxylesterase